MKFEILLGVGFTLLSIFGSSNCMLIHLGSCPLLAEEKGECPDTELVKMYLFTRKNTKEGQYVVANGKSDNISSSNFNSNHPSKLIIHGFNSDMNLYALKDIKQEYLLEGAYNVWMVNYPKLAEGAAMCYPFAVHNIQHVGRCVAQFVTAIRRHTKQHIHVIGFSLGAQVTNFMSNALADHKVDRITGLDPAGPLFTKTSKDHRLDASDAKFVDVVHTNGLMQGDLEQCGTVDFYMNGGVSQPGCSGKSDGCDHVRAPEYFAESIRSKTRFLAWKCDGYMEYLMSQCQPKTDLVAMGDHCPNGTKGLYVTYTGANSPYALGDWRNNSFQEKAPKSRFTTIADSVKDTVNKNVGDVKKYSSHLLNSLFS